MLAAMLQEHERGAGAWQAEWEALLELLRLTGSSAAITRELLTGLDVDPEKMRSDMNVTGGLVMSESVAAALASSVGRSDAQALVEKAARRSVESARDLREVLLELPEVSDGLGADRLDEALDPAAYLGAAAELIDRALAGHRGGG
jgi:3-carboxy-cis,cis-muconate cycloisomerase